MLCETRKRIRPEFHYYSFKKSLIFHIPFKTNALPNIFPAFSKSLSSQTILK